MLKSFTVKILVYFLLIVFFANCSEVSFRSDPLSLTMVKYENRSSKRYVFLASENDDCSLLKHKRIFNFLFFIPLNSFTDEEKQEISEQKMIRYKSVMRLGDFFWSILLFATTTVAHSIEVETCNTGMVAVTRRDPMYLNQNLNKPNKTEDPFDKNENQKEKDSQVLIEDTSNSSKTVKSMKAVPIIWNFNSLIIKRSNEEAQPFSIFFGKNNTELNEVEEMKLEAFAQEYIGNYSNYKILLIGHSEWASGKGVNLSLSQQRAESVKEFLVKKSIPPEQILLTCAGGHWGEMDESKLGKNFSRRVDIVFLN